MANWNPTNADEVTLIIEQVSRSDGSRTTSSILGSDNGPVSGAVVVDDFSIETEEDLESLTGIGNYEALGISKGDVEHSFSFTVQGEHADLFQDLAASDGTAEELDIIVKMDTYKDKLVSAYAGTRNLSVSNGDPAEFEVEGIALDRDPGTVSTDEDSG
jgi:hypothetical protein